jgi:hypothetical protein
MSSVHLHQGFDHVGYYSEELDAAYERFSALGFTVAPASRFVEQPFATCAITVGEAYVSISGVLDWNQAPEWMKAGMGHGLQAFVLRGKDLEEVYAEIGPDGDGILQIEGKVETIARRIRIDGRDSLARFRVLRLKRRSLPGLSRCNFCEHLTPEALWRPELMRHANGAVAIRSITAVHEAPAAAADFYRQLFGGAVVSARGDLLVDCRTATLRLVTPQRLNEIWPGDLAPQFVTGEPLLAGITLATERLADARGAIERAGLTASDTPSGGVAVAAADAYGGVIEFEGLEGGA